MENKHYVWTDFFGNRHYCETLEEFDEYYKSEQGTLLLVIIGVGLGLVFGFLLVF